MEIQQEVQNSKAEVKLTLDDLQVDSFITELDPEAQAEIEGGAVAWSSAAYHTCITPTSPGTLFC